MVLFYEENANTTAKCKDGDIFFDKTILCQRDPKFNNLLKGSCISMLDYDVETVRTFLNVFMEFEDLDRYKSLIILSLVLKYEAHDLLQKCIFYLKPTEMDEEVIYTLNLAIDLQCEELIDAVLEFLKVYGINKLFLQEQYYLLLAPKAVANLLRIAVRSALILKSVINWGRKYTEKHNIDVDLRSFFSKHMILSKLSTDCLDSLESVLELYELDSKKNVFTEKEILERLKGFSLKKELNYQWVDIEKGQTLQECFTLPFSVTLDKPINFFVQFNPTIHDVIQMKEKAEDYYFEVIVTPTIRCTDLRYHMYLKNNWDSSYNISYKIVPSENNVSMKSQILVSVQKCSVPQTLMKEVTITYKFYSKCKILVTALQLQPPWLQLEPSIDSKICTFPNFFTCGINF